jgi:glycerophosphoryl diester phosphodiesterase
MRRRIGRFLIGLLLVLVVVYTVLVLVSRPVANHPFFANQSGPLVIAHQGGDGLWPSNTMYAFEQAADLGVDVLEMDIHGTADGVLVVMHDTTVDRTTDGTGELRQMTLAEVQALDAGYRWPYEETAEHPFRGQGITVPTLEEVFIAFPDMLMNIEIKQAEPPIVGPFCQLLRQYERTAKTLVASFSAEAMEAFRQECPEVATSTPEDEVRPFFILNTLFLGAVYQAPAEAFQVPEYSGNLHVVTRRFVDNAHAHNIDVHVWTVDEEEQMRRLLALGVDGIITDRPDRLMQVLGR